MNDLPLPVSQELETNLNPEPIVTVEDTAVVLPLSSPAPDPIRVAAGRLGGHRVHQLAELGREYEREHGLSPGRQRLKQLIQLGRRYEQEHGLATQKPRRRQKGDAWAEFLSALARVVKPTHRAKVEQLVATLSSNRSASA